MRELFDKVKGLAATTSDKIGARVNQSLSLIVDTIEGLLVVVSLERSKSYKVEYDEKHYFVIPFKLSEAGFALHTMRCLPEAALEINDLPKRRIFHFPNEYYESALREHMIKSAHELVIENSPDQEQTLESIANSIDSIDRKLTYGMLLVGSVAAIFNPLVGVGIAAKAITPGAVSLLNNYGLKPLGKKMNKASIERSIQQAEQNVLKQFTESTTLRVTNPILQELELALRTTQSQHDPLLDPNLSMGNIPELDDERWRDLTERAIWHVYQEVYDDASKHSQANLGPEDIRWLSTIFTRFKD